MKIGLAMYNKGNLAGADKHFQKAVSITKDMVQKLIRRLRKKEWRTGGAMATRRAGTRTGTRTTTR